MNFEDIQKRAMELREKYDRLNALKYGSAWNVSQIMAGLVGDIGDLSKIIMAKQGMRSMDDVDTRLSHELSDCLWSILVIAHKYDINLSKEFMTNMDVLEQRVDEDLATPS